MRSFELVAFLESEPAKERTPHPGPLPFRRGEGESSAILPRNRAYGLSRFIGLAPRSRGPDSTQVVSQKNFES
jgi:hypothetical protein